MNLIDDIPLKIWDVISTEVVDPQDFYGLARTCRAFYDRWNTEFQLRLVGWRSLEGIESFIWHHRDNPDVRDQPMSLAVQTLVPINSNLNTLFEERPFWPDLWHDWYTRVHPPMESSDGDATPSPGQMPRLCAAFIRLCHPWQFLHRMPSFTAIYELSLENVEISFSGLSVMLHLPQLRRLRLIHCSFRARPRQCLHSLPYMLGLPLTHLALLHSSGDESCEDLEKVAALAACPNLERLQFTGSFPVLSVVSGDHITSLQTALSPSTLLCNVEAILPAKRSYRDVSGKMDYRKAERNATLLSRFLSRCPALTKLTIRGYVPCHLSIPVGALPRLETLRGPQAVIDCMTQRAPALRVLDIHDGLAVPSDVARGLGAIADKTKREDGKTGIDEVHIYTHRWDEEIALAVTKSFSNLRTIDLRYREGPGEVYILSFGPRLLCNLPALEHMSLHSVFYQQSNKDAPPCDMPKEILGNSFGEDERGVEVGIKLEDLDRKSATEEEEADHAEIAHVWKRYCPSLIEVGLAWGVLWRYDTESRTWRKRTYYFEGGSRVMYNDLA
ncbi:hypothetical protein CONPUDRAFT_155546 [Coniophora puteana RWD-64-598 SS2]|uniref:F-box domain-containing protein n=1 Tax=Coniophora puteana (strain RWD-64-598) TaxID=741705 RepID=A0A5M3MHW6_CONPW|nr:uncharacterized protein CONPUDRAFT_155546 [Coniophora puteana RWD-64-598 SS2]EIW78828.1 hypothetical protein CONPUDRAFT_155546 [Coniophora puteana RWD-64-598 SS2]